MLKVYAIGLALAVAVGLGNGILRTVDKAKTESARLQVQVTTLKADLQERDDTITVYAQHISQLTSDLHSQRALYAELNKTNQQLQSATDQRAQQIRRLQRENQELKDWTAVDLPEPVRCLRSRPTIATAADYAAWLSAGDSLPTACQ